MPYVQCGDETLSVLDSGGDGAALVFFGGNLLASEVWRHQLASPELSSWRRVAFDLPGHGDSQPSPDPESRYSLPGYAEILVSLVRELKLERVVVVGHSLGGHVVLEAAPMLPSLAGVFIFGAPPLSGPHDMARGFKNTPLMAYVSAAELTQAEAEKWAEGMLAPGAAVPPWMPRALRQVDPRARPLLIDSVTNGRMRNEVEALFALGCPAAIVQGEHEALVDRDYLEALGASLWRGGVLLIEGAGHIPPWEAPQRLNALLRSFSEEVLGGGA